MERVNCHVQAVTPDEPHRVKRTPVREVTLSVHRHDPRMFQPTDDFRFQQKPLLYVLTGPVLGLDLFERHFPVEFPIHGNGHPAQSALRMRTHDLKTQFRLVGTRWLHKRAVFHIKVCSRYRLRQHTRFPVCSAGYMQKAGLHIRVSNRTQTKYSNIDGTEALRALLSIAPVLCNIRVDQLFQHIPLRRRHQVTINKDFALRLSLIQRPGLHGLDQGVPCNELILQCENPEQHITVRNRRCHRDDP